MQLNFRNWSVGRFTVEEQVDDLYLVARDAKDLIRIRVRPDTLAFAQKRSVGEVVVTAINEIATIRSELIGGSKKRAWGLTAELRGGQQVLLVHSITEVEARGLAGALHEHCLSVNRSQGVPPPPPGAAPATDAWSVEEWRNQPPIG